MAALELQANSMENLQYNPLEARKSVEKTDIPDLPSEIIITEDSLKKHDTVEGPESHKDIMVDYNSLSDASKELNNKFMYLLSKGRPGGMGVQEAIFKFGIEHTIPNDLKQFISKTYGDTEFPEVPGAALFAKKLDERTIALRTRQILDSEFHTPEVEPPPPTAWQKFKNKLPKIFK